MTKVEVFMVWCFFPGPKVSVKSTKLMK